MADDKVGHFTGEGANSRRTSEQKYTRILNLEKVPAPILNIPILFSGKKGDGIFSTGNRGTLQSDTMKSCTLQMEANEIRHP